MERATFTRLEQLPNVGSAIAAKLRLVDVCAPSDLIGRGPYTGPSEDLSARHRAAPRSRPLDVFISAVRLMERLTEAMVDSTSMAGTVREVEVEGHEPQRTMRSTLQVLRSAANDPRRSTSSPTFRGRRCCECALGRHGPLGDVQSCSPTCPRIVSLPSPPGRHLRVRDRHERHWVPAKSAVQSPCARDRRRGPLAARI